MCGGRQVQYGYYNIYVCVYASDYHYNYYYYILLHACFESLRTSHEHSSAVSHLSCVFAALFSMLVQSQILQAIRCRSM